FFTYDNTLTVARFSSSYDDTAAIMIAGVNEGYAAWNRTAPSFVSVQGNMNMSGINPSAFQQVANNFNQNSDIVFVRADHWFKLYKQATIAAPHRQFSGDFNGDGNTDEAFYIASTGDWWMGISDGNVLNWRPAGNVAGFGNLLDNNHDFYQGDFNG